MSRSALKIGPDACESVNVYKFFCCNYVLLLLSNTTVQYDRYNIIGYRDSILITVQCTRAHASIEPQQHGYRTLLRIVARQMPVTTPMQNKAWTEIHADGFIGQIWFGGGRAVPNAQRLASSQTIAPTCNMATLFYEENGMPSEEVSLSQARHCPAGPALLRHHAPAYSYRRAAHGPGEAKVFRACRRSNLCSSG